MPSRVWKLRQIVAVLPVTEEEAISARQIADKVPLTPQTVACHIEARGKSFGIRKIKRSRKQGYIYWKQEGPRKKPEGITQFQSEILESLSTTPKTARRIAADIYSNRGYSSGYNTANVNRGLDALLRKGYAEISERGKKDDVWGITSTGRSLTYKYGQRRVTSREEIPLTATHSPHSPLTADGLP